MEKAIFINGIEADISEELKVVVQKVVSEFRNPLKKTGSFSYTVKFPVTQRNKAVFKFENERNKIAKFKEVFKCRVEAGGVTVLEGDFNLVGITSKYFEGFITGEKGERMADILDTKKKLQEISSFTPIDFIGDRTVWDYLDMNITGANSEIAFPFLLDSFARLKNFDYGMGYEKFGVSHFAAPTFRNIFTDAGYSLAGSILSDDTFNRLIMLYSANGEAPAYNYGMMNPCNHQLAYTNASGNIVPLFEGDDYHLFGFTPDATKISGDHAFSLGSDGVYTCKATGNYTFDIKVVGYAYDNGLNQPDMDTTQFLLFREIGNSELTDVSYFPTTYANVSFFSLKDRDTLNTDQQVTKTMNGKRCTHQMNFSAKLEEGKQYAVQLYMGIKTADMPTGNTQFLLKVDSASRFKITAMDGRQQLDPAKFLPDMLQIDFVNAMFKLFNLYYQIDKQTNVVTLYTRDEWFALNKNNIVDLSNRVNLNDFKETPLTAEETAETYYRWATDESDHLLLNTDYMERVNADAPEESYELPFAPLAFLRRKIKLMKSDGTFLEDYDLIPSGITEAGTTDSRILEDYTVSSDHSYMPKLALYYGAGILKNEHYKVVDVGMGGNPTEALYGIQFTRTADPIFGQPFPDGIPIIDGFGGSYKLLPKLAFFNVKAQQAYDVSVNTYTREFVLSGQLQPTSVYTVPNAEFVISMPDNASLATTGDKSIFSKYYANDLLILNYTNFTEGPIKMDSVLYQNLTGRQIIRIDNDLYLLAEIGKYEVSGKTAEIKLYRLIST